MSAGIEARARSSAHPQRRHVTRRERADAIIVYMFARADPGPCRLWRSAEVAVSRLTALDLTGAEEHRPITIRDRRLPGSGSRAHARGDRLPTRRHALIATLEPLMTAVFLEPHLALQRRHRI
jgi:hypothetical protein